MSLPCTKAKLENVPLENNATLVLNPVSLRASRPAVEMVVTYP